MQQLLLLSITTLILVSLVPTGSQGQSKKSKDPLWDFAQPYDKKWSGTSKESSDAMENLINSLQKGVRKDFVNSSTSEFNSWPKKVYVDPDVDFAIISSKPGMNWQECFLNPQLCVNPSPDTPLERVLSTPVLEREEIDPGSGEIIKVKYMNVRYNSTEGVNAFTSEGWIETSVLREQHLQPLYRKENSETKSQKIEKNEICDPQAPQSKNRQQVKALAQTVVKNADPLTQLEEATDKLRELVGQCPLRPPDHKKLSSWEGKNIYDHEALPLLDKNKIKKSNLMKLSQDGKTLSSANYSDVVAIDTLARTIYSEMNGCFKTGLQYPMAAAKVALNRSKLTEEGRGYPHFSAPPQVKDKPTLSKVLTAPWQFSVWNLSGAKNPRDKTVLRALCPAKQDSKNNWSGQMPDPADVSAWNQALKIATEAVLFQSRFEKKTESVSQLYYTSKRSDYDGRRRAHPTPSIAGRKVESFDCMYLWEGR